MQLRVIAATVALCCCSAYTSAQITTKPSPSTPVVVTNDTSSPVPVTVQGGVSISGSPNVTVNNTSANPVPVYGVVTALDSKIPFAISVDCSNSGNTNGCSKELTAPSDGRLEILNVSFYCGARNPAAGLQLQDVSILYGDVRTHLNLPSGPVFFGKPGDFIYIGSWSGSTQTLIHIPAGGEASFNVSTNAIADLGCNASLSGYKYLPI